jgi:hypothetical protein
MIVTSLVVGDTTINLSLISIGLTIVGIILSSGIAVLLYIFQKRSTEKLLSIQANMESTEQALNSMMNTELLLYRDLAPVIAHCYSTALGLHPDKELKGGPPEKDTKARVRWHRERSDELLKRAHTVKYQAEANIHSLPEPVFQSLNAFVGLCMNQAYDYAMTYIPDTETSEEGQGTWKERCYARNDEIKAAYESLQNELKKRVDELKKG